MTMFRIWYKGRRRSQGVDIQSPCAEEAIKQWSQNEYRDLEGAFELGSSHRVSVASSTQRGVREFTVTLAGLVPSFTVSHQKRSRKHYFPTEDTRGLFSCLAETTACGIHTTNASLRASCTRHVDCKRCLSIINGRLRPYTVVCNSLSYMVKALSAEECVKVWCYQLTPGGHHWKEATNNTLCMRVTDFLTKETTIFNVKYLFNVTEANKGMGVNWCTECGNSRCENSLNITVVSTQYY